MSGTGEIPGLPDFGFEAAIDQREVEQFCLKVLWPSVDHFWGSDFLRTAELGDTMEFEKRPLLQSGRVLYAINASCEPDFEYDGGPRSCHVAVGMEKVRDDLTDRMCEVGRIAIVEQLESHNPDSAHILGLEAKDDDGILKAWETHYFSFEMIDGLQELSVMQGFELQDEAGAVFWEGGDSAKTSTVKTMLGSSANADFDSIHADALTLDNVLMIQAVLLGLGVPQAIVDRDF